ncbi:MAG: hypothetical protein RSB16_02895 [Raoultibacter sp.]
MTKNKMTDLNDHLFMQLERLTDESLTVEELDIEITRSREVTKLSKVIVDNANTVLKAAEFRDSMLDANAPLPNMLGGEDA